jgi:hypothetical protein
MVGDLSLVGGRIVIVIKQVGIGQHQVQLRLQVGSDHLFYSRPKAGAFRAKRDAEDMFGKLEWCEPPELLKQSEPEVSTIAYFDF